jgi:hypothetical protein
MRIYARIIGICDIKIEPMEEERNLFEADRVHYEKW